MSTVLICRDALEDSVLGNLGLARAFARHEQDVVVIFTGEALRALDAGTFRWSENFEKRPTRSDVIAAAEEAGLPLAHGELGSRWSDVRALVRSMSDEPHVRLIACPLWTRLLALREGLEHLERVEEKELVDLLRQADAIVGGY